MTKNLLKKLLFFPLITGTLLLSGCADLDYAVNVGEEQNVKYQIEITADTEQLTKTLQETYNLELVNYPETVAEMAKTTQFEILDVTGETKGEEYVLTLEYDGSFVSEEAELKRFNELVYEGPKKGEVIVEIPAMDMLYILELQGVTTAQAFENVEIAVTYPEEITASTYNGAIDGNTIIWNKASFLEAANQQGSLTVAGQTIVTGNPIIKFVIKNIYYFIGGLIVVLLLIWLYLKRQSVKNSYYRIKPLTPATNISNKDGEIEDTLQEWAKIGGFNLNNNKETEQAEELNTLLPTDTTETSNIQAGIPLTTSDEGKIAGFTDHLTPSTGEHIQEDIILPNQRETIATSSTPTIPSRPPLPQRPTTEQTQRHDIKLPPPSLTGSPIQNGINLTSESAQNMIISGPPTIAPPPIINNIRIPEQVPLQDEETLNLGVTEQEIVESQINNNAPTSSDEYSDFFLPPIEDDEPEKKKRGWRKK